MEPFGLGFLFLSPPFDEVQATSTSRHAPGRRHRRQNNQHRPDDLTDNIYGQCPSLQALAMPPCTSRMLFTHSFSLASIVMANKWSPPARGVPFLSGGKGIVPLLFT